jgi:adenylate cyclase
MTQTAIGHYFAHEYEEAVETATSTIRSYPNFPNTYRWLAAALGQLGRVEEARAALDRHIALAPAALDMYLRNRPPFFSPEDHAHLLDGLRKAGWAG